MFGFSRPRTNDGNLFHLWNLLNTALVERTGGAYWLDNRHVHTLPHAWQIAISKKPTATLDRVLDLADELQDVLALHGVDCNLSMLLRPLRVEVQRPKARIVSLQKYWQRILQAPKGRPVFTCAVHYIGGAERLISVDLSQPQAAHVGIFGTTGSGKTVLMYTGLFALCIRNSPAQVGVVVCDPTGQNLARLGGLPHLMSPVAIDLEDCENVIRAARQEMERRAHVDTEHHLIVLVDEFADLLARSKQIEEDITAIARRGRNNNIHLIAASQKMTDTVPTAISQNLNCRFVGTMQSAQDAAMTGGSGCMAHHLPAGVGAFELRVTGAQHRQVRGLYVDKIDLGRYLVDIQRRWRGIRAEHFQMDTPPAAGQSPAVTNDWRSRYDASFVAQLTAELTPQEICNLHRQITGKELNYNTAKKMSERLTTV